MNQVHKRRLLNVARALEESTNPEAFNMDVVTHACGTPGCAFGHYIHRTDLQHTFVPLNNEYAYALRSKPSILIAWSHGTTVRMEHFDISDPEDEELFSSLGCGGATTAKQAAHYIRAFVNRREAFDHAIGMLSDLRNELEETP